MIAMGSSTKQVMAGNLKSIGSEERENNHSVNFRSLSGGWCLCFAIGKGALHFLAQELDGPADHELNSILFNIKCYIN